VNVSIGLVAATHPLPSPPLRANHLHVTSAFTSFFFIEQKHFKGHPFTTMKEKTMRERIQTRLEALRKEIEIGQAELEKVENQRTYLREALLRISGAIKVLEELLAEELLSAASETSGNKKLPAGGANETERKS
jgi:hypothetical protein